MLFCEFYPCVNAGESHTDLKTNYKIIIEICKLLVVHGGGGGGGGGTHDLWPHCTSLYQNCGRGHIAALYPLR